MLTVGSEVIHIMGPPAIPIGIPETFTCRHMLTTTDSIAWRIYYTNASGSTLRVSSFGSLMDLMSTVVYFTSNKSTSELFLNTTNRSITSIECNIRDGFDMTRPSSIDVVVYGKFCLFYRFIV